MGYVFDPTLQSVDIGRVHSQSAMLQHAEGNHPLAELSAAQISELGEILDVACGSGEWLLSSAQRYRLSGVGVDIDQSIVDYARGHARAQMLDDFVRFQQADATKPLNFQSGRFSLVNARFLASFLSWRDWQNTINELYRVAAPGAYIRLTECDRLGTTNSDAYERWSALVAKTARADGRAPVGGSIMNQLAHLLRTAGCIEIVEYPKVLDFSYGTEHYYDMAGRGLSTQENNISLATRLLISYLVEHHAGSREELEDLRRLALAELAQEDFIGEWYYMTVIGRKE